VSPASTITTPTHSGANGATSANGKYKAASAKHVGELVEKRTEPGLLAEFTRQHALQEFLCVAGKRGKRRQEQERIHRNKDGDGAVPTRR
jgi:hypothetical protein